MFPCSSLCYASVIAALVGAGCHAVQSSPVAPSAVGPVVPAPVIVSYTLDASFFAEVYSGGATQVRAAVWGIDASGIRHRTPGVPVAFSVADPRAHLEVLLARTDERNDAAAIMTVDHAEFGQDYDVDVTVDAGSFGSRTMTVFVCACHATPSPTPSPSPQPQPIPPPTPTPIVAQGVTPTPTSTTPIRRP